jgi:hypothetical protein
MIQSRYIKAVATVVPITYTLIPSRPILLQPASGNIHDEYWHKINGTFDITMPTSNPITQAIDPTDVTKILIDDSAITGIPHKYRFVGYKGGYYDEVTSTYRTISGTLSTYNDEFYTVDSYYVIDRLSWCGRLGVIAGSAAIDASMTNAPYSYCGFTNLYPTPLGLYLQLLNRTDIVSPTQQAPLNIAISFATCTFYSNGLYTNIFVSTNASRLVDSVSKSGSRPISLIRPHIWGVDDSI